MNSLEDLEMIEALYDASQAGVEIDLYIRGICCLKPGQKRLSENIRVFSVVGRFLEHSRIFFFQNGKENPLQGEFFIGSADWMSRNLHHRVEVITPVEEETTKSQIWQILLAFGESVRQRWKLKPDGSYERLPFKDRDKSPQDELMEKVRATKSDKPTA